MAQANKENDGLDNIKTSSQPDLTMADETPEAKASFWQLAMLSYLTPIVDLANRRSLEPSDLYPLMKKDRCDIVTEHFEELWKQECQRVDELPRRPKGVAISEKDAKAEEERLRPSFLRCMYHLSPYDFHMSAFWEFVLRTSYLVGPVILEQLISYMEPGSSQSEGLGFLWVFLLFAMYAIGGIAENRGMAHLYRVGNHTQAAIIGGVYSKSLRLSSESKQKAGLGHIMNMVGQDTQRIFFLLPFINVIWSGPLQFLAVFVLMGRLLGVVPVLPCVAILLLALKGIDYCNNLIKVIEAEKMKLADKRVKVVDEALQGMKVVKLYAWEDSLFDRVSKLRTEELKLVFKFALIRAFIFMAFLVAPLLMAVATFYTFVAYEGEDDLTPTVVFGTLALINVLRLPLLLFPTLLNSYASAKVSLNRIGEFFMLDELPPLLEDKSLPVGSLTVNQCKFEWPAVVSGLPAATPPAAADTATEDEAKEVNDHAEIELDDLSLSKPRMEDEDDVANGVGADENVGAKADPVAADKKPVTGFSIDVGFEVKPGELVEIIGPVGCGKTSLFHAILGEMKQSRTDAIRIHGSMAFVPQSAWVRNMTFRDNITFGNEYDKKKYQKVIDMCSLGMDRDMLPHGDKTEIGEKGINLSGGQKQRISLARALYADADIYLLDDPLSAVDAHVGRHIFYSAITDYLLKRGKTVILVTHQVQFLEPADRIFIMKDGQIRHSGTYEELGDKLASFAQVSAAEEEEEKKDDLTSTSLSRATSADPKNKNKKEASESESKDEHKLIEKEKKPEGSVPREVYSFYFDAAGGAPFVAFMLLFYFLSQAAMLASDWWLAAWTGDFFTRSHNFYMTVYACLAAAAAIMACTRIATYANAARRAAFTIHSRLLRRIMQATMRFFDTTPIGRLTDMFAKDQGMVEQWLPVMFDNYITLAFTVAGSLVFVGILIPWFFLPLVLLLGVFLVLQRRFLHTSRGVYRIWLTSIAPIYTFLAESVVGVSSIRAYSKEVPYNRTMSDHVNSVNNAFYHSQVLNRWLDLRLDLLGAVMVLCTGLIVVLLRDSLSAEIAGLALTLTLNLTGVMGLMVMMAAYAETFMTAVQRIHGMMSTVQEKYEGSASVPDSWPSSGAIEFKDVDLRYSKDDPLVLKGLSFALPSGTKLGIVGRTGAGKTTITAALFRLVEIEAGQILVDGQDTSKMNLKKLRSSIAVIPQDPVLFAGTVRFNLDPWGARTDAEINEVLGRVHLKEKIASLDGGLDAQILPGGSNLSVGQRQLFCLARALLRQAKMIFMDEATASVDPETDHLIQHMIREEFKECTVLTIAHRLNTIAHSDLILVMDKGSALEFDSPAALLAKPGSEYGKLLNETAKEEEAAPPSEEELAEALKSPSA